MENTDWYNSSPDLVDQSMSVIRTGSAGNERTILAARIPAGKAGVLPEYTELLMDQPPSFDNVNQRLLTIAVSQLCWTGDIP